MGVLGNRTRLWDDPKEAYAFGGEIGFRETARAGGGSGSWTKVPHERVFETAEIWTRLGRKFVMDDGAPECRTLQGEVCRTIRGLEGYLDTVGKLPMRPAMAAGHLIPRTGAAILALVDKFMDPSSQDDLWMLLDLYPDATVEFSCFEIDVGNIPNRNSIFWEVRNY